MRTVRTLLFAVLLIYLIKLPPVTTSLTIRSRGNPVKCLAQGHNKRTCRPIFTLPLFTAEHQAGKL